MLSQQNNSLYGQSKEKIELEIHVSSSEVPDKALKFIENQNFNNRVKWYYEITSGRKSYEAKFNFKGDFHSVEFDTLGNIEDIEVISKFKNLDKNIQKSLDKNLLNIFKKYKIIKLQRQYIGNQHELETFFKKSNIQSLKLNFEIELEGKNEKSSWNIYEILTNSTGEIIQYREISMRPTDNLNY